MIDRTVKVKFLAGDGQNGLAADEEANKNNSGAEVKVTGPVRSGLPKERAAPEHLSGAALADFWPLSALGDGALWLAPTWLRCRLFSLNVLVFFHVLQDVLSFGFHLAVWSLINKALQEISGFLIAGFRLILLAISFFDETEVVENQSEILQRFLIIRILRQDFLIGWFGLFVGIC